MEPKQRTFSVWYTVLAMLVFFGIQAILLAPHPENMSYSEFKALLRAGKTQYGMSDELGLGTFERARSALFLNGPSSGEREYGEDTARMIDVEVRRLLEAAHLRVQTTLREKRSALEMLAKVLIEKEVVDRDALTALLAAQEP